MKKILSILFVGIIILTLVSCSSVSTKTTKTTEANAKSKEKTESNENKSNTQKKYTRYKINEVGKTGNYQLKTEGYNETNEILGATQKFATTNKYIVVNIEIAANDAAVDFGYSTLDFKLVDSNAKVYNCDSDITIGLNVKNQNNDKSYVEAYESLNPNVFKKTQIVFEVPPDAEPTVLVNKNEGSQDYIELELK